MSEWNLGVFDRRHLIQLTLDVSTVTTRMPCHMVELADLSVWVDLLGVDRVLLRLRSDGRVDVTGGEFYRGQYVTVHTTADLVRDLPLQPDVCGSWERLPVDQLSRLESFHRAVS